MEQLVLHEGNESQAGFTGVHYLISVPNSTLDSTLVLRIAPELDWASLVAQTVKCLSPMLETRVRSLGWEDPLEIEMATHSSTLAWKTPWTEEPGGLQSMGSQRIGHD